MWLIIDTTAPDWFKIVLAKSENDFELKKVAGRRRQAEKLLLTIDSRLKKSGLKLKQIKGVGAISGPGAFTSLRIGLSAANALGYALGIPVVGVRTGAAKSEAALIAKLVKKLKAAKKTGRRIKLALPFYGGEPNITKNKRP